MASVIDALVVSIGLDPRAYQQGQQQVERSNKKIKDDIRGLEDEIAAIRQKSTKDTRAQDTAQINSLREVMRQKRRSLEDNKGREQEQLKREKEQARALGTITNAAREMFAVFGVATTAKDFVNFVMGVNSADAATGRFADNLGEDAQTLNAFGAVVEQLGGKADEAKAAFANLASIRFNVQAKGDVSMLPTLSRLGVSANDLNDLDAAMRKIAATAKTMPKPQFYQYAHAAGFSDSVINALELGDVELARRIQEARKREALNQDQIRRSQEAQRRGASALSAGKGRVRGMEAEAVDELDALGLLFQGRFGAAWKKHGEAQDLQDQNVAKFWNDLGSALFPQAPKAATKGNPVGSNGSLADRHNNPGNLTDGRGHLLSFPTLQAGVEAMKRQILTDYARGQNTVSSLINDPKHGWSNQWAPGNSAASTQAYIKSVAKALGVSASQRVNFSDPAVLAKLVTAMNAVERGGRSILDPGIISGAGATLASHTTNNTSGATVTNDVQIGRIEVNVPAGSDGKRIAQETASAVRHQPFVAMANTGLA